MQADAINYFVGDKFILVANTRPVELLLFSRSGVFLRRIGNAGKGPGEYLGSLEISVDEKANSILVADNRSRKFLVYDLSGNLKREKSYNAFPGLALGFVQKIEKPTTGNFLLFHNGAPTPENKSFELIELSENLDFTKGARQEKPKPGPRTIFASSSRLQTTIMGLRYWSVTDTLFSVGKNLDLQPDLVIKNSNKLIKDPLGNHVLSRETSIEQVLDTRSYVIIEGTRKEKPFVISFNKKTHEGKQVFSATKCGWPMPDNAGIENDLFGYSPVFLSDFCVFCEGRLVLILPPEINDDLREWLGSTLSGCLRSKPVSMPEKRDELVRLLEAQTDDSGPILAIITLK